MNPILDAFLRSWPFEPWVCASIVLTVGVYLRGWLSLYRRDPRRWPLLQPVAFAAGLLALYLALASPIESFTSLLLQIHMLQHVLLMMIVPPLAWLGAPLFPLLLGLPRPIRRYWAAPLMRWQWLRRTFETVTHPVPALVLFTATTWFWHLPPIYEFALASNACHYLQHFCFLVTALLFWYPVIRPYPSRPTWSPWLLIPYLILADVQNTLLSALLTFSDQPLYSYYVERPRLGNLSALDDQAAAGVLMWVPGSVAYLVPLFVIGVQLLFGAANTPSRRRVPRPAPIPDSRATPRQFVLPVIAQPGLFVEPPFFDVVRVPLLGRFLRWRHARLSLQIPLLLVAAIYCRRWVPRAATGSDEPGRRAALDSLAWFGGSGNAGDRQRLLHGLSVLGAPDARTAMVSAGAELAAMAAKQMVGGRLTHHLLVGLRGLRSLGQPLADGMDCAGLLRGRLCDRRFLFGCVLLQVCLPDRPVQFRAIAHFTRGNQGARPGRMCIVRNQRLYPRTRWRFWM